MALQLYHDEECTQPINASNPDTVYVIRFQETGKEIPEHILAERQQIRERSDMAEQEILTLSTIEEVKNYVIEKG